MVARVERKEHHRYRTGSAVVLGLSEPDFKGEIIEQLEKLHESGTVRVIDSLVVYKDDEGELEVEHLSNLTRDEAVELGTKIGALIGLGIEGEGMVAGAQAGAAAAAEHGVHLISDDEWKVQGGQAGAPHAAADRRIAEGPPAPLVGGSSLRNRAGEGSPFGGGTSA